jgi:superfamily II helicase
VQGYKDVATKYDMVLSVKKHFDNFQIDEVPVIESFLEALDRSYAPVEASERQLARANTLSDDNNQRL